jgi:tripartite-type tricarboxylate transporter receptor subunit TctC
MNALRPIARWSRATTAALMLAPALFAGAAHAQPSPQTSFPTWPQKTVRFVIPLPPGSGTDLAGRLLAERLTERWGQPVVVENR